MVTYTHPDDNRGPMVLGWLWTTTILAILGVMMRLYARLTTKAIGWDDYLIIAATAVTVFGSSVNQVMVDYGFGRHVEYVLKDIEKIVMWTIIAELQSYLAIGLVKLSVCWFILRMIQGTHRILRASILVLMAILGIMVVVAMLLDALQCFPLEKAWKEHLPGSCISKYVLTHFTIAIGVIGCITDFACVLIPLFLIRGLKMNRRTKWALGAILSFGLVPGACAIGKSVTTNFQSKDQTYDFVPVLLFAAVECNFGIFVASLPALRPFFRSILKSTTSEEKPSHRYRLSGSEIKNTISGISKSKGTRNILTTEDNSDDIPLGKIGVSRTLDIASEPRGSKDDETMKPYYPGDSV